MVSTWFNYIAKEPTAGAKRGVYVISIPCYRQASRTHTMIVTSSLPPTVGSFFYSQSIHEDKGIVESGNAQRDAARSR